MRIRKDRSGADSIRTSGLVSGAASGEASARGADETGRRGGGQGGGEGGGHGNRHDRAGGTQRTCQDRPFLTTKQAAYHLGFSYDTLRRWRRLGQGPRCRLHGGIWAYHVDDLVAWSLGHARGERP